MLAKPSLSVGTTMLPAVRFGSFTVRVILLVAGSIREMLAVKLPFFPPPLPTQTAPSPAAMSVGTPRVLTRPVTAFVFGSMRETVPSWVFRTQTAPSPTATLLGARRTR